MKNKKMYSIGTFVGILGIILLLILIVSGTAYPDTTFRVLMPTGLLLVFAGLLINGITWLLMIKDSVADKSYKDAGFVFLVGLVIVLIPIIKMIFFK